MHRGAAPSHQPPPPQPPQLQPPPHSQPQPQPPQSQSQPQPSRYPTSSTDSTSSNHIHNHDHDHDHEHNRDNTRNNYSKTDSTLSSSYISNSNSNSNNFHYNNGAGTTTTNTTTTITDTTTGSFQLIPGDGGGDEIISTSIRSGGGNTSHNPSQNTSNNTSITGTASVVRPAGIAKETQSRPPEHHTYHTHSQSQSQSQSPSQSRSQSQSQSQSLSQSQSQFQSQSHSYSYSVAAPPRTSSLLPPPRNTNTKTTNNVELTFLDPLTAAAASSTPERHSRSSSDGFRNLNRWSASTSSSRASKASKASRASKVSDHQQSRLHTFSRRLSIDSFALLAQQADPKNTITENTENTDPQQHRRSSSRKLTKRQPSNGSGPRSRRASSPPLPSSISVPAPNLPPIISLPPLDTNPESANPASSPRLMSRASPAVSTPNSVFSSQHNGDHQQDYFWNDLADPNRTASPAVAAAAAAARPNPSLLPPAPVVRDAMPDKKGHTRGRPSAARSSSDSTRARDRTNKPSQKAMLSKALAKANAAVQLDNAQNYNAARESYLEACHLLQQVLARTSGEEDRKKLEAIRRTYTSRIDELDGLDSVYTQNDKALPARPESFDYHGVQVGSADGNGPGESTTAARGTRGESPNPHAFSSLSGRPSPDSRRDPPVDASRLRHSPNIGSDQHPLQSSFSKSPMRRNFEGSSLSIPRQDEGFMPAPLSPRRLGPPAKVPSPEPIVRQDFSWPSERFAAESGPRGHRRNASHESASWLDPIDESGGSAASSVHSRSSSIGVTRRHIRHTSGDTEAEFDAALDAAVEAAYDDGYEPTDAYGMPYDEIDEGGDDRGRGDDAVSNAMRKVELAKERVRQTEREAAIEFGRDPERQRKMSLSQEPSTFNGDFFDANDSDEEERILEEMTRGYVMGDFSFGQQSQPSQSKVPRESDSSGVTSRTWHSSMGSNPPTATTVLSTVTETPPAPASKATPPPPPSSALPPPPQSLPQVPPSPSQISPGTGVRNRRLSGQNHKQLKIETSKIGQPPNIPPPLVTASAVQSKGSSGGYIAQQRQALSATSTRLGPFSTRAPLSPVRGTSPAEAMAPASPPTIRESDEVPADSPSSARPGIRKNFSSSSLKSLKTRQFSVSHIDDSDLSPNTPLTHQISNTPTARPPAIPALPTPMATTFHERMTGGFGGLHLFDSDFHSPTSLSVNTVHHLNQNPNPDVPIPLEPCPADVMLRPFWLMRALYQTLAHPRGGYISNRLFVPRDAWKVKGVKIRALEDKIAQCDLLTAALLKLARADSNDADAVLEEMQSLENVLETVQTTLTRKLGSEVGTQGISADKDAEATPALPRSTSVSGKGGAFSWRRLRNKNSAANMTSAYGGKSSSGGSTGPGASERDTITSSGSMQSLPMTANPSTRTPKRDVASVKFDGPYGNYMASLARLFDAAQTLDQIARQVEDPGLRHADKTQVGLELCTRHAAEFFGFYICRFVLTDLTMLLDKFVKRSSEWVLN